MQNLIDFNDEPKTENNNFLVEFDPLSSSSNDRTNEDSISDSSSIQSRPLPDIPINSDQFNKPKIPGKSPTIIPYNKAASRPKFRNESLRRPDPEIEHCRSSISRSNLLNGNNSSNSSSSHHESSRHSGHESSSRPHSGINLNQNFNQRYSGLIQEADSPATCLALKITRTRLCYKYSDLKTNSGIIFATSSSSISHCADIKINIYLPNNYQMPKPIVRSLDSSVYSLMQLIRAECKIRNIFPPISAPDFNFLLQIDSTDCGDS
jgi:hypothetical protein